MIGLHPPFRRAAAGDRQRIRDLLKGSGCVIGRNAAEPAIEDTVVGEDGAVFAVLAGRPGEGETWQVDVLAVAPDHSLDEFGSRLLAIADALAADEGLAAVRVTVEKPTHDVRVVLEREGFRTEQEHGGKLTMTRPVVPQG
jgi:GNAT superfamily N-acetyltransferase